MFEKWISNNKKSMLNDMRDKLPVLINLEKKNTSWGLFVAAVIGRRY